MGAEKQEAVNTQAVSSFRLSFDSDFRDFRIGLRIALLLGGRSQAVRTSLVVAPMLFVAVAMVNGLLSKELAGLVLLYSAIEARLMRRELLIAREMCPGTHHEVELNDVGVTIQQCGSHCSRHRWSSLVTLIDRAEGLLFAFAEGSPGSSRVSYKVLWLPSRAFRSVAHQGTVLSFARQMRGGRGQMPRSAGAVSERENS